MSIISESENIATMTVNHYERILRERDEAREAWYEMQSSFERSRDEVEELIRERDELAALLAAEKATRNLIIEKAVKTERERDEAREQNAKLRDIAERAIDDLRWFYESKADGIISELDQIKEGAK
jgi:hypothetical protein